MNVLASVHVSCVSMDVVKTSSRRQLLLQVTWTGMTSCEGPALGLKHLSYGCCATSRRMFFFRPYSAQSPAAPKPPKARLTTLIVSSTADCGLASRSCAC